MTPQETFVTRLRRHRQRARVSIEEIAANLRVRPELVEAMEKNDLSAWPRGLYARAWIRGYALVVDLDPVDTVEEFCRLFPQGDRRAGGTIQEIASIVASPSEYRDEFSHPEGGRRSSDPPAAKEARPAWHAFVTQPGRALWNRLTGAEPAFRNRRAPRTHP
jgi:transcriptional regulator with XRE-family HTH domain